MIVRCKCGGLLEFTDREYTKFTTKQLLKSLDTFLSAHYPCYKPEWDEKRMDIIGQNGNLGDHYEST